ncbi:MAG: hypothetical protein GYB31_20980 [Bacteroidetes bacterium]|nr:hypothetical protein [Bacteroidota bacterium]
MKNKTKQTGKTVLLLFLILPLWGQAQTPLWTLLGGTADFDYFRDIHIDSEGNSICTGYFQESSFEIAGQSLPFLEEEEGFILKVDQNGSLIWAQSVIGNDYDGVLSATTDDEDNIYVSGNFYETMNFQGEVLTAAGTRDAFIAKLDPDGNLIWIVQIEGGIASCTNLFWQDNALYASGSFFDFVNFGEEDFSIPSNFAADAWLGKVDPSDGLFDWVKTYGGEESDSFSATTLDDDGNIYAAGYFSGEFTIGGTTLEGSSGNEPLLIKMDNNGDMIWTVSGEGLGSADRLDGVSVDNAGNVYAAGRFSDELQMFGQSFPLNSSSEAFIFSVDGNGDFRWAHSSYTSGTSYFLDICDAPGKNLIYATGSLSNGTGFLNDEEITDATDVSGMLGLFETNGNYQGHVLIDGPAFDYGYAIDATEDQVNVAYAFQDALTLPASIAQSDAYGLYDCMLVSFDPPEITSSLSKNPETGVAEIHWDIAAKALNIELLSDNVGSASIWNVNGVNLAFRELGKETRWNVDFLPAGQYIVSVETDHGTFAKAFQVVK